MEITGFTATCECTFVQPNSLLIQPRSTEEVTVTIDLTTGGASTLPNGARKFAIRIQPAVARNTTRPSAFILRGIARDLFAASTKEVDLGEILSRTAGEPKTVRLTSAVPLSNVIASPQPDMTVELRPTGAKQKGRRTVKEEETGSGTNEWGERSQSDNTISYGDAIQDAEGATEYVLTVTPSDQIPIGPIDRRILLQSTDATGRKLPEFLVKVSGKVIFDVVVEPQVIYAGLLDIGSRFDALLTLRSRTRTPFDITSIEQQDSGLLLEEVETTSTSERLVRLCLRSAQLGDQRAIAKIAAVNLLTGEQTTFQVPVRYYGARPLVAKVHNTTGIESGSPID